MRIGMLIGLAALLASPCAGCEPTPQAAVGKCNIQGADPVPVEVRAKGDDGLTRRLWSALRSAYGRCGGGYDLEDGPETAALTVTITENVRWERFGPFRRMHYRVGYSVWGKPQGEATGACWEARLSDCARAIMKAAPAVSMA